MDAYADGDGRRSDADRLYITTQGLDYRLLIELPILSDPTNSGQICALSPCRCSVAVTSVSFLSTPGRHWYNRVPSLYTEPGRRCHCARKHRIHSLLGLAAADDMTDSYVRMPTDCMNNPWILPYDILQFAPKFAPANLKLCQNVRPKIEMKDKSLHQFKESSW